MRFVVMVEGQEGVTWEGWLALAEACERLGFDGLFRSDHYLSVMGDATRGSLDAWGTICALAARTETIRLGTLVSPATFRHPSVLAKLVVTADHVSGGRVEVGLGTGWMEREHEAHGFPFPSMKERMDGLAEQLEIVTRSWAPGPFTHEGAQFTLRDADPLPKPVQQPAPPIVMGGQAGPRAARLAARYAAEYNLVYVDPATVAEKRRTLEAACEAEGRDPATLGSSLMTPLLIGEDEAALGARAERLASRRGDALDLAERRRNGMVGTPQELVERLGAYAEAGLDRVFLQLQLHDDLEQLDVVADTLVPAFA